MDEKQTFLIRYEELGDCLKNQSFRDMLNLALALRLILLEGLMDLANKGYKLKFKFKVGLSVEERDEEMKSLGLPVPNIHFLGIFPPNESKKEINRDDLLKFKVASYNKSYFSIKELITVCANKLGGVHMRSISNDNPTESKIRELGKILSLVGLQHGAFSTLIIIGNVVHAGLSELANSIDKN